MTNQDKAIEVIRTWQERHQNQLDNNTDWAAQNLAGDLAQAGLLAPDLPEPDECPPAIHKPGWNLDPFDFDTEYVGVFAGRVWVTDWQGLGYNFLPSQIRNVALALLAAAQYAEEA